jgi:hypothetical protein
MQFRRKLAELEELNTSLRQSLAVNYDDGSQLISPSSMRTITMEARTTKEGKIRAFFTAAKKNLMEENKDSIRGGRGGGGEEEVKVMCHTPHFLSNADLKAPLKRENIRESGYLREGNF